jgi:hypothetical protein
MAAAGAAPMVQTEQVSDLAHSAPPAPFVGKRFFAFFVVWRSGRDSALFDAVDLREFGKLFVTLRLLKKLHYD